MNFNRKIPIFINPNLDSSAEDRGDLLARFNKYGEVLQERTNGRIQKLCMTAGFQEFGNNLDKYPNLELIRVGNQTRNFLSFGIRTVFKLKKLRLRPSILISSDLYFAFCATLIVCFFTRPSQGIQISFHGTFLNTTDGRLKAHIRKKYLAFVIRNASIVRVVSPQLLQELNNCFDLSGKSIFVAPVPVSLPPFNPPVRRSKTIAFVGRIHHERGLDLWVSIISQLNFIRKDFSCLIVGGGENEKNFKHQLSQVLPPERLKFTGKLSRVEVFAYLPKIQILLSTAPSEGFGVAIREAMSAGTFVCASKTLVTSELDSRFPNLMRTFDSEADGISQLNKLLDQIHDAAEVFSFRENLEKQNESNLEVLIQSWI